MPIHIPVYTHWDCQGKFIYPSGNSFEGKWFDDIVDESYGTMTYNDDDDERGGLYVGQLKSGMRHGEGILASCCHEARRRHACLVLP